MARITNYSIERLRPHQVTTDAAIQLEGLGQLAWESALRGRSPEQIKNFFNPNDERHVANKRGLYKKFARHGSLVVARTVNGGLAGFAMARNDVSGSIVERTVKRVADRSKVYAWLAQVNVHPLDQYKGIGGQLVNAALEGFPDHKVPTAYIFEENTGAQRFFNRLGFRLDPPDQVPQPKTEYFGEAHPVDQLRFSGPSVGEVQTNALFGQGS